MVDQHSSPFPQLDPQGVCQPESLTWFDVILDRYPRKSKTHLWANVYKQLCLYITIDYRYHSKIYREI